MRRILLIAALLLLPVSSVMATTTITAVVGTQSNPDGVPHRPVTITYSSDVDVRAFALDLAVDNGTNIGDNPPTDFLAGESVNPNTGYGIFPSRFRDFIDPANPDPCWSNATNYNPTTAWDEPGAENTGLGWPSMVVELGTLYKGEPNKPALTGTLFTFDVNSEMVSDCNLTITADDLRGAIVGSDANEITATNLPYTIQITFAPVGCTVPDVVGMTRDAAIAAIATAGFTGGIADNNVAGSGEPVSQVIAQDQTAGSTIDCATVITLDVVSEPFKPDHPDYATWASVGKPTCWAYERQCKGDANGTKQILYWVSQQDLDILRTGLNKTVLPAGAICADFNHQKQILYRVSQQDLDILRVYLNKTVVPSCDATYMNYWCTPGNPCPTAP